MPGPAPKQKDLRVRKNVPRNGDWIELPADPYTGPRPDLRGLPIEGPACKYAKDAWEAWWASPMAHQWLPSDWPVLLRLFSLADEWWKLARRGDKKGALDAHKAMVALENQLGLTEDGRNKLRWLLPPSETEAQPDRKRGRTSTSAEMRKRLSVVDGAG